MKIIYKLVVLFVFFLSASFNPFTSQSEMEKAKYQLIYYYTKDLKKKENLILSGIGGMNLGKDKIQLITLCFSSKKALNLDQTRALVIDNVEDLLKSINSNQRLHPFLHDYPFTSKNINFSIIFEQSAGEWVQPPFIAYVHAENGKIRYDIRPKNGHLQDVNEETYQEALKIVKEQKIF